MVHNSAPTAARVGEREHNAWPLTTTHLARTRKTSPKRASKSSRRVSGKVDEDEAEAAESFELPGADLSHEELAVEVMPRQEDEFTCMSCFLVHHRSQLADAKKLICRDCA
jgi:hypothetical protein